MTTFNLPLNSNTTKKFLSPVPFLDVSVKRMIPIPSQHPFTARKLSPDFILNGTHSHPESTRLTSSEHSLIAVSASVPHPLCCNLKNLLSRNGYPRGISTYNMNDVVTRNKPKDPISTVPKRDVLIVLPYLGLQSKFITKQLKSCIYKFYGCINLKIIFPNTHRIKSLLPYKGKLNRSLKSKVVYDDFYIGKTRGRLHDRKTEHFKALMKSCQSSAIADHIISTGHNIKWDHF